MTDYGKYALMHANGMSFPDVLRQFAEDLGCDVSCPCDWCTECQAYRNEQEDGQ